MNRIPWYLCGVLVVALAITSILAWGYSQRAQAAAARAELAQVGYVSCRAAVERQAAALDDWREAALAAEVRAGAAEQQAGQVRIEYRDRVRVIERDAPPADTSCPEAVAWAAGQYQQLAGRWGP